MRRRVPLLQGSPKPPPAPVTVTAGQPGTSVTLTAGQDLGDRRPWDQDVAPSQVVTYSVTVQ